MDFLKKMMAEAYAPQESIVDVVMKNMAGFRPARDPATVHASSLTKDDFCPRAYALYDVAGKKPKDEYLDAALALTFDVGNATADLFTNVWAGQAILGDWRCTKCGDTRSFCTKPGPGCKQDPGPNGCHWRYQEVKFVSQTYGVSGSIDAIMRLSAPKLFVTELKIIKAEEFEKLAAPLAEHRIRTSLYMKLIEDSDSAYKDAFNLQEARVVYVSRGYGKKDPKLGKITPFKEYAVKRNDGALGPYLQKAQAVKVYRDKKLIPAGVCATTLDPRSKKCSVCAECFSGKFPVQQEAA